MMGAEFYALFDRALVRQESAAASALTLDDALGAMLLPLGPVPESGMTAGAFDAVGSDAVLCVSEGAQADVASHFRRLLKVQTESGERLYFRYYDPRVLRAFLPSCSEEQVESVFGEVQAFYFYRAGAGVELCRRKQDGGLEFVAVG